jgi:hypothetical protein
MMAPFSSRDAGGNLFFTGDTRLTKPTAYITTDELLFTPLIFYLLRHSREEICETLCLIMPLFADGTRRAPFHACAAGPLANEQAVFSVISGKTRRRRDQNIADNTPHAPGRALSCDKTVINTEGAQTGDVTNVAL